MKEICKNCKQDKYIVNRTHKLCDECNSIRLHGKTIKQRQLEQFNKQKERSFSAQKTKPVKQFNKTKKQSEIDYKYAVACEEIKQEREPMCESCGKWHTQVSLSFSHIISRKRCKEIGREDLIYDKRNLLLECFGGPSSFPTECHNQHELHDIEKIKHHLTYQYKMQFIKENDIQLYSILTSKTV